MTYHTMHQVACTNKKCTYEGTISICGGESFGEKKVCPKCGFKTLDQYALVHTQRFLQVHPASETQCIDSPNIPKLLNRADGVNGHYCIARTHKHGYNEFWNHTTQSWGSAGTVFALNS